MSYLKKQILLNFWLFTIPSIAQVASPSKVDNEKITFAVCSLPAIEQRLTGEIEFKEIKGAKIRKEALAVIRIVARKRGYQYVFSVPMRKKNSEDYLIDYFGEDITMEVERILKRKLRARD